MGWLLVREAIRSQPSTHQPGMPRAHHPLITPMLSSSSNHLARSPGIFTAIYDLTSGLLEQTVCTGEKSNQPRCKNKSYKLRIAT